MSFSNKKRFTGSEKKELSPSLGESDVEDMYEAIPEDNLAGAAAPEKNGRESFLSINHVSQLQYGSERQFQKFGSMGSADNEEIEEDVRQRYLHAPKHHKTSILHKHQQLPDLEDFLKSYNHGILLEADNCMLYQLDSGEVTEEFLSSNSDGMLLKVGVLRGYCQFSHEWCLDWEHVRVEECPDKKFLVCLHCGKTYRDLKKQVPWLLGFSEKHNSQPARLCGLCFTEAHKEAIDSTRINIHEYVEANLSNPTKAMELCLVHRLFTTNSRLMLTLMNEYRYIWKNRREDHKKMLHIINFIRQWIIFLWDEDFALQSQARQHLNTFLSQVISTSNGHAIYKDIFQAAQLLLSGYRKQYLHERQVRLQQEDIALLQANKTGSPRLLASSGGVPLIPLALTDKKPIAPVHSNTELADLRAVDCTSPENEADRHSKKFDLLMQSKQEIMEQYRNESSHGKSFILGMCGRDYDLLFQGQGDSGGFPGPLSPRLNEDASSLQVASNLIVNANAHTSDDNTSKQASAGVTSPEKKNPKYFFIGNKANDSEKEREMLMTQILEHECRVIAEQLTLMMFEKFKKITPTELLQKGWTRDDKSNRAPNVVDMIFFCESISVWVQLEIIAEKPANRQRAYEKFIRIARELEKINNQYGQLQVFAGLDSHYVTRFKKLEKALEASNNELSTFMKNTAKLMNTSRNFFNLRQGLWRLETPCIPYLGVFLKDAFMVDELFKKSKIGRADPEQTKRFWDIYYQINAYRQASYNFPQYKRVQKFLEREFQIAGEIDSKLLSAYGSQLAKAENAVEKPHKWGW